MDKYTYSISNDFLNAVVNLAELTEEIEESTISGTLSHIDTRADACYIYFSDNLTTEEETTLSGVVAAHAGDYEEPENAIIAICDVPADDMKIWLDSSSSIVYYKDNNRNDKWLSISKHAFEYARKGGAKGMYLPLLGDLDSVDDTFMSGRSATILSVFCKSKSGNQDAEFEIRKNGATLYEFAYDGSDEMRYINDSLNFDIALDDEIQVYVKNLKPSVNNTYCKIEISWRY